MARPGMLVHLVDVANLITLGGLALAFFACWAVLSGQPSLAMALAASAVVIDNVDGWMARRAVERNPAHEHFGRHLDCYADYITKGLFPVLYLLTATDLQLVSVPVALIYLMAIAVRYSYEFVPDRAHIGLSPDYMIAFLCPVAVGSATNRFGLHPHAHGEPGGFCGSRRRAFSLTEVEGRAPRRLLPLSAGPGGGPSDRRSIACKQGSFFVTAPWHCLDQPSVSRVDRRCSLIDTGFP